VRRALKEDTMQDESMARYIEMAILTERNGRDFYDSMAGRFSGDEEISSIFRQLSRDEAMHEAQFREIAAKYPAPPSRPDEDALLFLRATSISRFFARDFPQKAEQEVEQPQDALMLAFQFEKSTLLFYGAIQSAHGESKALAEIIDMERQHLFQLMKVILTDARFRGLADAW
jgi:rubrerythrin